MGTHLEVVTPPAAGHSHGRTYSQIVEMIRGSQLPPEVQSDAVAVFTLLGDVEAHIHGSSIDEIHFHEVGAVDSIVDIVGGCAALHLLGIEALYSSPVTDGYGTLECAHGTMPVPAPATLELLKGVPLITCEIPFELVTPTGAAILRHFSRGFGRRPAMVIERVGYGAGSRDLAQRSNLLRVSIGSLFEESGGIASRSHEHGHFHFHPEPEQNHGAHGHSPHAHHVHEQE
jgi:hypothetical protein